MELEKLIGEKIKLEELKPIQWDKEGAWKNIRLEKQPKRISVYLIAASLVMAISVVSYFVQINLQEETQRRINRLETSIASFNTEGSQPANTFIQTTEACEEENNHVMNDGDVERISQQVNPEIIPVIIPGSDFSMIQISQPIDSIPAEVVAATEENPVITEREVEAIIGFIPVQRVTAKTIKLSKSEKLRFKFSLDRSHPSSKDLEKGVLTARIN